MPEKARWLQTQGIEFYTPQNSDNTIVYNPLSGETHQLNLMAIDALLFFNNPATTNDLTHYISELYQVSYTEIAPQMQHLIVQLDALGLIESWVP